MMSNLKDFIESTSNGDLLLPDFQRKFVWNEIDHQKRLVASVLTNLPIGSLLILKGKGNEFVSKKLGRKDKWDTQSDKDYLYLLDGQQRLTVLVNVFSNKLHEGISNQTSQLQHPSLLNRFFLKISNINSIDMNEDVFGFSNLQFKFKPTSPQFTSMEIFDYIEANVTKYSDSTNPFNPHYNLFQTGTINTFKDHCFKDGNLNIPLFLLNDDLSILSKLVEELSKRRQTVLIQHFMSLTEDEKSLFVNQYFNKINGYESILNRNDFVEFISRVAGIWETNFNEYLNHIIVNLNLSIINVDISQRARAIEIYENLNMGGVSLSTFDLIIAKAARIDDTGLYENIIKEIFQELKVPDFYRNTISRYDNLGKERSNLWCANRNFPSVYSEKKNEIASTFINVFLNLLAVESNIKNIHDELKVDSIKKQAILSVTAEKVVGNYKKIVKGILRALMFLQMNCGIRKMNDIAYDHIIFGIAYFLMDDENFNDRRIMKMLEYWYWSSVFSGEYDKDQSIRIINDIKLLDKVKNNIAKSELLDRGQNIFTSPYFSDVNTLLMRYADVDKLPKNSIKDGIIQFILKDKPVDFREQINLEAWEIMDLDVHHIIPLNLGTIHTLDESSQELRKNNSHILNSPLNLTIIKSTTNRNIGGMSPIDYLRELETWTATMHMLPSFKVQVTPDNYETLLIERFNIIRDKAHVLLNNLATEF